MRNVNWFDNIICILLGAVIGIFIYISFFQIDKPVEKVVYIDKPIEIIKEVDKPLNPSQPSKPLIPPKSSFFKK